jgi:hypothetical protein
VQAEYTEKDENSKNKSFDAIFKELRVEIDEQPDFLLGQFQVGQNLRLENGIVPLDALDLYHYGIFDEQVKTVNTNQFAFVTDWQTFLPSKS